MDNFDKYQILQWNLRGFYHKRYILKQLISFTKPFIICLQECFYFNDKELNELFTMFDDYIIYFKNRDRQGPANPRGGVALLVHKTVPHRTIQILTDLEAIAINILYKKKRYWYLFFILTTMEKFH